MRLKTWQLALSACIPLGGGYLVADGGTELTTATESAAGQRPQQANHQDEILHDCAGELPVQAVVVPAAAENEDTGVDSIDFDMSFESHMAGEHAIAYSQYTHDDHDNIVDRHKFSKRALRVTRHGAAAGHGRTPRGLADGYYQTVVRVLADTGDESTATLSYEVIDGKSHLLDNETWETVSDHNLAHEEG